MYLSLADDLRTSGLIVVELPGWKTNKTGGDFRPRGTLVHHTGSYDEVGDKLSDLEYAEWLCFEGRSDLPGALCNVAMSAESVLYVGCAGNANHAGYAKATGPMPAADDGNEIYVGFECMNDGSQGWGSLGVDASGNPVTQAEGIARAVAALHRANGWPASHSRGHRETSITGKWDPGLLDLDAHRRRVDHYIKGTDVMNKQQEQKLDNALKGINDLTATVKTLAGVVGKMRGGSYKRDMEIKRLTLKLGSDGLNAQEQADLQALLTQDPAE